jgi:sporulation protein YabP
MNSSITVNDRSSVLITGVKSVESITVSEVLIYTELGDLLIKGQNLESDEFDPVRGIYRIRGYVVSIVYLTEKQHLPDNIVSRLFR